MKRRDFLKVLVGLTAALALPKLGSTEKTKAIDLTKYVAESSLSNPLGFTETQPDESPQTFSHFAIAGEGSTEEEAVKNFWRDYKDREFPDGGKLYWRRYPEVISDYSLETGEKRYLCRCRFSVGRQC